MAKGKADDGKSCGPKLFCDDEPSNEWGLEELSVYARIQYRQILDAEKLLAPAYWRLGRALVLAKKAFKHGKWSQHLKDLGIDKTRASRARAIFGAFSREQDVAGLTVEEAYAQRQRKQPPKPDRTAGRAGQPKQDVQRLRKSVRSIGKRAEDVIHDAAFIVPEEAVILAPAVREVIRKLQDLLAALERQAVVSPNDGKAEKANSQTPPKWAT